MKVWMKIRVNIIGYVLVDDEVKEEDIEEAISSILKSSEKLEWDSMSVGVSI